MTKISLSEEFEELVHSSSVDQFELSGVNSRYWYPQLQIGNILIDTHHIQDRRRMSELSYSLVSVNIHQTDRPTSV